MVANETGSHHRHCHPEQQQQQGQNDNADENSSSNECIFKVTERLWKDRITPTYGHDGSEASYHTISGITDRGYFALKRVLIALEQILGIIDSAPIIPTLTALLLTNMSESYVFTTIREMTHDTLWFFPITKSEQIGYISAFQYVIQRLHPQTAQYLDDRGILDFDSLQYIFRDLFVGYVRVPIFFFWPFSWRLFFSLSLSHTLIMVLNSFLEIIYSYIFIYHSVLPLHSVQRIVDIYTLEGSKVLFRVGVALFVLYKREAAEKLVTISNAKEWWETLKHWANHRLFNFDVVLRKAYGVHGRAMQTRSRFPSRVILQRIIKAEEWRLQVEREGDFGGGGGDGRKGIGGNKDGENDDDDDNSLFTTGAMLGLAYHNEQIEVSSGRVIETVKPILAQPTKIRQALANWVPITMRLTNLELMYSTNYHGRSLDMFYSRLKDVRHSILLLEVEEDDRGMTIQQQQQDDNDENERNQTTVIGMYASQAWRISTKTYGDGECFLFRASPNPKCWKWHPDLATTEFDDDDMTTNETTTATTITATTNNAILHQFMIGQSRFISMGGNTDGSCGLRLNEDFTFGESSSAAGFDNEPLHNNNNGSNSVFSVGLLEVYGLVRQIDGKAV